MKEKESFIFLLVSKQNYPRTVEENKDQEKVEIYSQRVRAGKRTYFFDIKSTRSNDYYLTITESKRRFKDDGYFYEKHKIFLYKEDFDKFLEALKGTIDHVKTELMPDVDFSKFEDNGERDRDEEGNASSSDELTWD
ncbi:DNA-binding protein [Sporocytophaga myxococcoides]|uniref:DNA-binding protein n=1 Tax=Sporocytophaga myxococcoides TaxID=153721 RepID=A0A098LKN9_9BACT|nr:DNA-binding protein [Sporocytophaga myxococcoides]